MNQVFFFAFSKTLLETRFRCILDRAPNLTVLVFFFSGGLETIIDGPRENIQQQERQKKAFHTVLL